MKIPYASPTGQMGGGLLNANFAYIGESIADAAVYTYDHRYELAAGTTLLTPLGWWYRGPTVGAAVLWKLRQFGMLGMALHNSSGGGGPGEPLTSTESPPSLEKVAIDHGLLDRKASEHTSSPAAAGNSAHGGRRSGSKPRKRCPPGYRWSRKHRKCMKSNRLFPFRPWHSRSKYTNGKRR